MTGLIAEVTLGGDYLSMGKAVGMLILAAPWLLAGPWMAKDSDRVRAPRGLWPGVFVGAGALAMLLWMLIPFYAVGLMLYVLTVGAVLLSYIVYRNAKVGDAGARIDFKTLLTPKARQVKLEVANKVRIYTKEGKNVRPPDPAQETAQAVQAFNLAQDVLYDVLWHRASEVDIVPAGQQARVRFVIDGVPAEREPLALPDSELLVQYVKSLAGMEVEDRRRPQRGQITVDLASSPVELMVTSAGTTGGQRLQFRVKQECVQTNIEQLGMPEKTVQRLREITRAGQGLLIVSGKSGTGVTSTLYSVMKAQDAFIKQIYSLESKTTVELENITQNEYETDAKLPGMLSTVIRRDPDYIMVDRCGDADTAKLIQQASAEKFVILGMSASDTFSALAKWVKVAGDVQAVAHLKAVVCQVLLRRLCPTCREPYKPDANLLAKANIPASKVEHFYRPPTQPLVDEKGKPYTCPTCQGSGYFGRTAVFELLELTDEIRSLILSGASLTQIKAEARKNRMLYLQEEALRKVIDGITSIQEVVRVTQTDKK